MSNITLIDAAIAGYTGQSLAPHMSRSPIALSCTAGALLAFEGRGAPVSCSCDDLEVTLATETDRFTVAFDSLNVANITITHLGPA